MSAQNDHSEAESFLSQYVTVTMSPVRRQITVVKRAPSSLAQHFGITNPAISPFPTPGSVDPRIGMNAYSNGMSVHISQYDPNARQIYPDAETARILQEYYRSMNPQNIQFLPPQPQFAPSQTQFEPSQAQFAPSQTQFAQEQEPVNWPVEDQQPVDSQPVDSQLVEQQVDFEKVDSQPVDFQPVEQKVEQPVEQAAKPPISKEVESSKYRSRSKNRNRSKSPVRRFKERKRSRSPKRRGLLESPRMQQYKREYDAAVLTPTKFRTLPCHFFGGRCDKGIYCNFMHIEPKVDCCSICNVVFPAVWMARAHEKSKPHRDAIIKVAKMYSDDKR